MKTLTFFKDILYNRLINLFLKKGLKNKIKSTIDLAFKELAVLTGVSTSYLLAVIFSKLNIFVEVKDISVRRSIYSVPFPLTVKRRSFIISKWILKALQQNKKRLSFKKKFINEFNLLYLGEPSKVVTYQQANLTKAYKNRSNLHYRW
jgi:ribosomal protein S7